MNQQEIDRLWDSADGSLSSKRWGFGVVTEWRGFTKDQLTAAIQEAVAQARRQALEEVKELTSKERPIGDFSYWTTGYNCAMWTIKEHCNDAISALMAQEAGE